LRYWLILPAAGTGRRFGAALPKQYLELAGRKVIEHALAPFLADPRCQQIVVALDPGDTQFRILPSAADSRVRCVAGGAQRCDSVRNAILQLDASEDDWVLVHDAARPCLTRADLDTLIAAVAEDAVGGLLAVPLADTLKQGSDGQRVVTTASRESLWRALTPQMFRLGPLRRALQAAQAAGREPTDEAQALEWCGHAPRLVAGRADNLKITMPADLKLAAAVLAQGSCAMSFRVGSGFDVHAFGPGDGVMLGGVWLPWNRGVVAHSDGDVLLHALTDALLGAGGLGDIGQHFPDTDPQWRGAASTRFVAHAVQLLARAGWRVVNADLTLLAEAPRVAAYRPAICQSVAAALGVPLSDVNLKATTTEKLGFIGRSEGLAAQATVLIARA
jgi:2-C-methyl-D-erythritol 4-phosphate cytidylyltransferase/2-C-methyl-D-erythritol 2,4-cyclodiphosphate synthase